ncbi:hypothetical protein BDV39DRAFT_143583 [Aspergillus sergii]|uniref:Uncharacterized protein n=1 Tax=Aspergillus sergii TaxID=1034303 RepID=A0A5N6WR66_9EURO|nr:hypothetical protein BDV39DRAFT_143583 [Aspergillus sergii]
MQEQATVLSLRSECDSAVLFVQKRGRGRYSSGVVFLFRLAVAGLCLSGWTQFYCSFCCSRGIPVVPRGEPSGLWDGFLIPRFPASCCLASMNISRGALEMQMHVTHFINCKSGASILESIEKSKVELEADGISMTGAGA